MSLQMALRQILPNDRIRMRLIDRLTYASDAGFYALVPEAVVQPHTVHEVTQLMQLAKRFQMPLVFRAGGTSLSGQSITNGILVDLSQHWRGISVQAQKGTVTVQPGITGAMVNHYLKPHHQKIGPDPSSISAAMMGGILSNNASGMCCGVVHNSYHTLQTISFVLPSGHAYNTADVNDYQRFVEDDAHISQVLLQLRAQVCSAPSLHQRIRAKYKTKNTVGYGLNALIDFEHPLDILAHLLVGAEGTLAFIAEATLRTLPDLPHKATGMLYFANVKDACQSIVLLTQSGAAALELMDRASLRSVEAMKGLPPFFATLPAGAAAILCEYQTETVAELEAALLAAEAVNSQINLLHPVEFTTDASTRNFYWKMRKGMFPSVGAVRERGTTVLLEDVAFPVERLAEAVLDLQRLFEAFYYHNAIIFGHAKDGNIHFVITQLLDTPEEVARYDQFMQAVVRLVVNEYDGALKAEHGTGRNMAPFVEAEWGGELYEVMSKIKTAVDPNGLLNPGVIINASKTAHIEHLKALPQVEEEVDKCIECGYCEPACPSRDLTMTPRRRIVARRVLAHLKKAGDTKQYRQLLKEYQYDGLDTCATDGLCAGECPVNINTGDLVKRLRKEQHSKFANQLALGIARRFVLVEAGAKGIIGSLVWLNQLGGWQLVHRVSASLHRMLPAIPVWINEVGAPPKLPTADSPQPQVVYFTACINRLMSSRQPGENDLQHTFLSLCKKAGIAVMLPSEIAGYCCGQPFSSKGFGAAASLLQEKTVDALLRWSNNGALPIVCDFSSCTYSLVQGVAHLSAPYRQKFARLQWIDSVAYLSEMVLPKLKLANLKQRVVLHPTCAVQEMGLSGLLQQIASACAATVHTPAYAACCGMAGDRGFYYPELTEAATKMERDEAASLAADGHYASACTCEISLSQQLGRRYHHIAYLLDEVSG
jgi:D-lactate dehydrogenase